LIFGKEDPEIFTLSVPPFVFSVASELSVVEGWLRPPAALHSQRSPWLTKKALELTPKAISSFPQTLKPNLNAGRITERSHQAGAKRFDSAQWPTLRTCSRLQLEHGSGQAIANRDARALHKVLSVEKMSEVLLDFAKPLFTGVDKDSDAFDTAVGIAVTVWNISQAPEDVQDTLLDELLDRATEDDPSAADGLQDTLVLLLERRRQLYPDNNRIILDYKLIRHGIHKHLDVVSTVTP
jgi:hypothetical protein